MTAELNIEQALGKGFVLRSQFFKDFATEQQTRLELECGEVVEILLPVAATRRYSLARAPAGSNARIDGNRLIGAISPGLYAIACEMGGWSRSIEFVAIPTAVMYPRPTEPGVVQVDQSIMRHPDKRLRFRGSLGDDFVQRLESQR